MNGRKVIALPVEGDVGLDSEVCQHFGHAPAFALVEVDGARIESCRVIANPMAGQHQPGLLPGLVRDTGADVLLAGGIGPRAVALLEAYGVEVATGAEGRVRDAIASYRAGRLGRVASCDHGHHPGGGCDGHGLDGHGCHDR